MHLFMYLCLDDSISVNYPSIDSQPPYHGGILQDVSTKHHSPSMWIYPLADWIWTWQFANGLPFNSSYVVLDYLTISGVLRDRRTAWLCRVS